MDSSISSSIDEAFQSFAEAGKPQDLGRVFELAAPELLALGRLLRLDEELAQDALQETFLVVLRRLRDFDSSRAFMPWATGIFLRSAQALRRRRRARELRATDVQPRGVRAPDELLESREVVEAIDAAIEALPAQYRDVIRETLRDGAAPREIAQRHGITPNAVSIRVHRGMRVLRQSIAVGALAAIFSAQANARSMEVVWPKLAKRAAHMRLLGWTQLVAAALVAIGATTWIAVGFSASPARSEAVQETRVRSAVEVVTPQSPDSEQRVLVANEAPTPEPVPASPPRRVQVLGTDGQAAAAGLELQLLWTDERGGYLPLDGPPQVVARTQADGWIELPPSFLAASASSGSKRVPLLLLRDGNLVAWQRDVEDGEELSLTLQAGGQIEVQVEDRFGDPVADALVTALPVFLPFAPFPDPVTAQRGYMEPKVCAHLFEARTDRNGRALFQGLPVQSVPTPLVLRFEAQDFLSHVEIAGFNGPGETSFKAVLVQDTEFAGRVHDEFGEPVPGASVRADFRGHVSPSNEVLTETDGDGEFFLGPDGLQSFPLRLRVGAPGHADVAINVHSPVELKGEFQEILLPRVAPLTGRVVNEAGKAIEGVRVRFANADDIHETRSDAFGAFRFDRLRPGPGELWAEALPRAEDSADNEESDLFDSKHHAIFGESPPVELILRSRIEKGGAIALKLIDATDQTPLQASRARLHAAHVEGWSGAWPADELELVGDEVRVANLPAGDWVLFVDAGGGRMGYVECSLQLGQRFDGQLSLGSGSAIDCVLPPSDSPWTFIMARLDIDVRPPDWFDLGDGLLRRYAKVASPGERTLIDRLTPGHWQVTAASLREFANLEMIELAPGETQSVSPEASPSGVLNLRFAAREGSVRLVLHIQAVGELEWTKRQDQFIEPYTLSEMPLPIPTGPLRWRARFLHPVVRETEAQIYLEQSGLVDVRQGQQVDVDLQFRRTP